MLSTKIPPSICFVILLKKPSIMFNQEPCLGVNTNFKTSRNRIQIFLVFWMYVELSRIIRMISPFGYFFIKNFRKSKIKKEFTLLMELLLLESRSIADKQREVPQSHNYNLADSHCFYLYSGMVDGLYTWWQLPEFADIIKTAYVRHLFSQGIIFHPCQTAFQSACR